MAWNEYKKSYQSTGRLMYCLSSAGVPIRVIEDLIFEGSGKISYRRSEPFATYHWEENTPVFKFALPFACYQEMVDANMQFIE